MSETAIRFRGGIVREQLGFRSLVELNGARFLSDEVFATEEAALNHYWKVRDRVLAEARNNGLKLGPNLGGYTEIDGEPAKLSTATTREPKQEE